MRWPWQHAKDAALERLQRAETDDPKVRDVAEKAALLARRNGFGEAIVRAMGGQR